MILPIAQIQEIIDAANHAAAQDFKWWFVALLFLFFLTSAFLLREFLSREKRLTTRLDLLQDDQTATSKERELNAITREAKHLNIIAENTRTNDKLVVVLEQVMRQLNK